MKVSILVARVLLGLIFFVFGLNGFFGFMEPPPMNEAASSFIGALIDTGYMLPVLQVIETACGALLLAGVFVPLALTLLAPIIVNIFFLHVFLDTGNLPLAMLCVLLEIFLAWAYCGSFSGVLRMHAEVRT